MKDVISIQAEITEISYNYTLRTTLKEYSINQIEQALSNSACKIRMDDNVYGVSTWVSPKRTRSYPFERVYNTCYLDKKVTIIPIVKDEGSKGDRDYIQWDTVSLMSLLNVYVIVCWYDYAEQSSRYKNKITKQQFNYQYVKQKLEELKSFQSDALHWNIKQVSDLKDVAKKARKFYYEDVPDKIGVKMHSVDSYDTKMEKITKDAESFKESSRSAAEQAQHRESLTTQPKENVIFDKGVITVKNWIGGTYYWTVDELVIINDDAFFIEKKHDSGKIPSLADIKDGFLKNVLYSNINTAKTKKKELNVVPVIGLTGNKFQGILTTNDDLDSIDPANYNLDSRTYKILQKVFHEANTNGIHIFVVNAKKITEESQIVLLRAFL